MRRETTHTQRVGKPDFGKFVCVLGVNEGESDECGEKWITGLNAIDGTPNSWILQTLPATDR